MTANVLLVSAGIAHPPLLGRYTLRRLLSKMTDLSLLRVHSLEALPQLELEYFQGMILYYHQNTISDQAIGALDDFIRRGGGALAIHSATASFMDAIRYFEILGGRFAGHGPVETFDIIPSQVDDDIFDNLPGFTNVDELYLHDLEDDIRVHYYANYQGERAPMVWTRLYGEGRVCYACPGHRTQTMRIPAYQAILQRALRWVCAL
jgi:type 1 glutamine amidotransferase